jgi:uncharacterized cofD-like protein
MLLRGLRPHPEIATTAMVCVSDNGGSSGRLRRTFSIPAVGDLRNCLVALSDEDNPLAELFQYRFPGDEDAGGHALGNLVMTALLCRTGSLSEAVTHAAKLVQSRGRVLPSTETPATLCAEFERAECEELNIVRGEVEITRQRRPIRRVWLEPDHPEPTPGLLAALLAADVIVLGPGSLYTSTVPNLLVRGVPDAIRESGATVMLVSNLMTQPGESEGYTAADHLSAIEDYLGAGTVHFCLMNSRPIHASRLARYTEASPVENDLSAIARHNVLPIAADLLDESTPDVRHDSCKLARLVAELWRNTNRGIVCPPQPLTAGAPQASISFFRTA